MIRLNESCKLLIKVYVKTTKQLTAAMCTLELNCKPVQYSSRVCRQEFAFASEQICKLLWTKTLA